MISLSPKKILAFLLFFCILYSPSLQASDGFLSSGEPVKLCSLHLQLLELDTDTITHLFDFARQAEITSEQLEAIFQALRVGFTHEQAIEIVTHYPGSSPLRGCSDAPQLYLANLFIMPFREER